MASHQWNLNYAVLAAFVVAVLLAGAAIFYFGGGTEAFHPAQSPEELAPDVQRAVRDGPSPDLQHGADAGR
ncbi:MAG: hypothetical protein K0Q76_1842 [Panacagrimonas sp.]|jgi:hypothetical protein|nr:hypothetical protein [Panacagrimonas sp.]MCC2656734.1 hypothetical protein [Panacagrimonas sp.]